MATNVNIPTSDSNLHDWVAWHKDLVKTYNSASVLLSSKDGKTTFGANELASNLWNAEWDKLGLFATAKNNIGNPITTDYNDDKKYLRMWLDLRPSVALGLIQYDPTFTGIQIGVQAGEVLLNLQQEL